CRMLTRNEQAAEDALQETFLAAVRGFERFRGDASVRTWLFTIARRVVYKSHRRRAGEPTTHEPLSVLGSEAGWGEPTPEDWVAHREQRDVLQRALSRLRAEDQEVLTLRDLEDLSVREVADVMGLEEGTVRVRHHRARLRLMAEVQKEKPERALEEVNHGKGA
ncbi:MAG: sigma-70 family RNA polymerase sigma factor, partial [Myxococcota bacterium]